MSSDAEPAELRLNTDIDKAINKTIDTGIDIEVHSEPHADMIDAVQRLGFGSEGLRYQRLNVHAQLQRFASPVFFHATSQKQLIGSYVLDKRELLVNQQAVTAYYRGLLSVEERWQGHGIGRQLAKAARHWMEETAPAKPVLSYGCIDQSNTRSLKLLQAEGAFIAGSLSMYMMYHQWPAQRCDLVELHSIDPQQLRVMTEAIYGHYGIRDISHCAQPGYALVDADGIVASARISDTSFRITQMGKLAKWTTRCLVTPFAVARKRFDPDCFRYIGFSEVLIRPGCEASWPRFVSTVLAQRQCHFGAVYVDPRTRLFGALQKASGLSRCLHSTRGDICVVVQTHNHCGQAGLEESASKGVHLWPVDS